MKESQRGEDIDEYARRVSSGNDDDSAKSAQSGDQLAAYEEITPINHPLLFSLRESVGSFQTPSRCYC